MDLKPPQGGSSGPWKWGHIGGQAQCAAARASEAAPARPAAPLPREEARSMLMGQAQPHHLQRKAAQTRPLRRGIRRRISRTSPAEPPTRPSRNCRREEQALGGDGRAPAGHAERMGHTPHTRFVMRMRQRKMKWRSLAGPQSPRRRPCLSGNGRGHREPRRQTRHNIHRRGSRTQGSP